MYYRKIEFVEHWKTKNIHSDSTVQLKYSVTEWTKFPPCITWFPISQKKLYISILRPKLSSSTDIIDNYKIITTRNIFICKAIYNYFHKKCLCLMKFHFPFCSTSYVLYYNFFWLEVYEYSFKMVEEKTLESRITLSARDVLGVSEENCVWWLLYNLNRRCMICEIM